MSQELIYHCSKEDNVDDLGGNIAFKNYGCNGIFIQREGRKCVFFDSSGGALPSTSPPTIPLPQATNVFDDMTAPRGGQGYFNYDLSDALFGPNQWKNVKNNPEHLRFIELKDTHKRNLENNCHHDSKQSPIDLCENKINAQCDEHHQTRTHVSLRDIFFVEF